MCKLTSINAQDDVGTLVAEHIYSLTEGNWSELDVEKQKKKSDSKKKLLNTQAVELMTIARLKETNGYIEIKRMVEQINVSSNL